MWHLGGAGIVADSPAGIGGQAVRGLTVLDHCHSLRCPWSPVGRCLRGSGPSHNLGVTRPRWECVAFQGHVSTLGESLARGLCFVICETGVMMAPPLLGCSGIHLERSNAVAGKPQAWPLIGCVAMVSHLAFLTIRFLIYQMRAAESSPEDAVRQPR